jgi:hypothetical protein
MGVALTIVVVLVLMVAIAMAAVLVVQRRHHIDQGPGLAAPADDPWLCADRSNTGWHGPSASGGFPAVPAQRTGEHDRSATADPEPG